MKKAREQVTERGSGKGAGARFCVVARKVFRVNVRRNK